MADAAQSERTKLRTAFVRNAAVGHFVVGSTALFVSLALSFVLHWRSDMPGAGYLIDLWVLSVLAVAALTTAAILYYISLSLVRTPDRKA